MLSRITFVVVVALAAVTLIASGAAQADMIGYWNFNNNVADYSGYGNNGTLNGSVSYVAGKFGQATSYDGTPGTNVSVADSASLHADWPGFVVSLWINTGDTTTWNAAMGKFPEFTGEPMTDSRRGFGLYPTQYGWLLGTGVFSWPMVTAGASSVTNSQWHNVALLWDGASMTSYLDGTQVGGPKAATPFLNSSVTLWFGSERGTSTFTGQLDDAAIFDTTLTVGQIASIHNVGTSELGYSMGDMSKLFDVYSAAVGATTTTSDGKTWKHVDGGLPGTAGQLAGTPGSYSVVFSDTGSAGVQQVIPEPSTLVLLAAGLFGLLAYAWRKRR